jgi:DNA-binding response OmpR family regulator
MKLLVVDDDADLVDLMTYALGREGYRVVSASDGQQALARWQAEQPDLVLLDINLPKVNGFEVCRRIRRESRTPVVMLTARREEEDVLQGLQVGADDYMTKPFSTKQLSARLHAVLRRYHPEDGAEPLAREVRAGSLVLDLQAQSASNGGPSVALTQLECRLLHLLAVHAGRVVPYERLIEYGWGFTEEGHATLLKTHISHLRAKLRLGREVPGGIRAIVGIGYMLTNPPARAA